MVFDVPAESGGALTILREFYNDVQNHVDSTVTWIIVVSNPVFQETENIKILRFPWVKKSWIHRIYFDQFIAPRLVKKFQADKVFSLQNLIIPKTSIEQIVYVHQPLPFVEYKFSFKENKLFWLYQNIIGKKIYRSIKKANKVIVQTNWLKRVCVNKLGICDEKIIVVSPKINLVTNEFFSVNNDSLSTFFYPAGGSYYKNHRIIVEACEKLKEDGVDNYKIILTLSGNENNHIIDLNKIIQERQLPIYFIGSINREEVFKYYTRSILLFPSYLKLQY